MKKFIVNLVLVLTVVCGFNAARAKAYSVELVKNGIYAEYIPENVMETAPVMFKRNVDKVMKYYKEHKNESEYDFLQNVPLRYKDLHDAIGNLKNDDKIVICNPFIIYDMSEEDVNEKYMSHTYYFLVKKNNENISLFTIYEEEGKLKFDYNKVWDKYTGIKNKITDDTLFYWGDGSIYAQTKNKNEMVYDGSDTGGVLMNGSENVDTVVDYSKFKKLSYDEKDKIIMKYLRRTVKISGKNWNKSHDKTNEYVCGTGKISDKDDAVASGELDLADEVSDYDNSGSMAKDDNSGIGVKKIFVTIVIATTGVIVIVAAGILYKRKHR